MNNNTKRVLSFALASTVVAGVPTLSASADCGNETVIEEVRDGVLAYTVVDGDTLGKIAERFCGNSGYWEQLAEFNNMALPCQLAIGDVVYIPKNLVKQSNIQAVPTQNTEVVVQTPDVVTPCEEDQTYTVKNGDTMFCIVRVFYGVESQEYVDKLATYNGLKDPNKIGLGQVLNIPCKEKLLKVEANDYTEEYNRMGAILYERALREKCKPCNPCGGYVNPCFEITTCPEVNPCLTQYQVVYECTPVLYEWQLVRIGEWSNIEIGCPTLTLKP